MIGLHTIVRLAVCQDAVAGHGEEEENGLALEELHRRSQSLSNSLTQLI